jgi:hypothetical protein
MILLTIGQPPALQRRKINESLLSSNGSWTDDDCYAEGDANVIAFINKDSEEGHAIYTPVHPTTLFNNNRIPVSCLMERDEVSILNGI